MTTSPSPPRSEYERLLRFVVTPGRRFGLLAACVNDSRREAELRQAAIADAEKAGVAVAELDLRDLEPSTDVLGTLEQALRNTAAPVLFIREADRLAPSSGSKHYAQALNFARDRLPKLLPARIVLWMSAEGRTRLAQAAPDLANIILSTLVFPTSTEGPPEPMLHRLGEETAWYTRPLGSGDSTALAEQSLLARVVANPETSVDARLDAGLRIAEIDAARGEFTRAVERAVQIVELAQENDRSKQRISGLFLLAEIAHRTGRTSEAVKNQSEAHQEIATLLEDDPESTPLQRLLAGSHLEMGDLYKDLGRGEKARMAFMNALQIAKRLANAEPDRADFQRDLSVSFERVGDIYEDLGLGEKAREAFIDALQIAKRLANAEPDRTDLQRDLAISLERMAAVSEGAEAARFITEAIALRRRVLELAPDQAVLIRGLGIALFQHYELTEHQPSLSEAATLLVELRQRDALEARYHELADQLAPYAAAAATEQDRD